MNTAEIVPWMVGGGSAGFGLGTVFVAVRWAANFIAGRLDKREARVDEGTHRLIDRLEKQYETVLERLTHVESELAECTRKHAQTEAELMQLRGFQAGMGDARQHAQLIVSAEKAKEPKR